MVFQRQCVLALAAEQKSVIRVLQFIFQRSQQVAIASRVLRFEGLLAFLHVVTSVHPRCANTRDARRSRVVVSAMCLSLSSSVDVTCFDSSGCHRLSKGIQETVIGWRSAVFSCVD